MATPRELGGSTVVEVNAKLVAIRRTGDGSTLAHQKMILNPKS